MICDACHTNIEESISRPYQIKEWLEGGYEIALCESCSNIFYPVRIQILNILNLVISSMED